MEDLKQIFKTGEHTIGDIKEFFKSQILLGIKKEETLGYFTDTFVLRYLYDEVLIGMAKRMMVNITERQAEYNDLYEGGF